MCHRCELFNYVDGSLSGFFIEAPVEYKDVGLSADLNDPLDVLVRAGWGKHGTCESEVRKTVGESRHIHAAGLWSYSLRRCNGIRRAAAVLDSAC
jgi:hypothetical protein